MGAVTAEASAGHRLGRHRRGAWTALVSPGGEAVWAAIAAGEALAPDSALRDLPRRCSPVLRDDSRSFVGIFAVGGQKVVAKSFREQDRRLPARIASRFRESRAFRTLRALRALESGGVAAPSGLLALERRRWGTVVESWLFYSYIEGSPCTAADVPAILALLGRLHALGWVHGDPHIQNFLMSDGRAFMLDPGPHRKRWGRIAEWYDVILFRRSRPDLRDAVPIDQCSVAFRTAEAYDRWVHDWRQLKRTVRSWLGERQCRG
jgi:tRNA A-37 threonylcarbamoyl transferase component Bud32